MKQKHTKTHRLTKKINQQQMRQCKTNNASYECKHYPVLRIHYISPGMSEFCNSAHTEFCAESMCAELAVMRIFNKAAQKL